MDGTRLAERECFLVMSDITFPQSKIHPCDGKNWIYDWSIIGVLLVDIANDLVLVGTAWFSAAWIAPSSPVPYTVF